MYGKTAVAAIRRRAGVAAVFCFPNNIRLTPAPLPASGPSFADGMHDGEAVNMADSHRRVNKAATNVVNIVPGGPGIENAFSSLAPAYADS